MYKRQPSYKASVAARVTGSDGTVLVFAASGEVFGTNEPGDREDPWDQTGTNPLIRYQWAGLKHAQLTHDLQHDADFFGSAASVDSSSSARSSSSTSSTCKSWHFPEPSD